MDSQSNKTEYRKLRDSIYTYFYYLNKPVAVTEVVLQFKGNKKAVVEKVLDDLVGKKMIFLKLSGKAKIYCLAQDMKFSIDESIYTDEIDQAQNQDVDDKVLRYLKWNYDNHTKELSDLKEENKELNIKLTAFENHMPLEEIKQSIDTMKADILAIECADKSQTVSSVEFNKIKKKNVTVKKELSKRSTLYKDMVDQICDGLGKSRKSFFTDVGLEE